MQTPGYNSHQRHAKIRYAVESYVFAKGRVRSTDMNPTKKIIISINSIFFLGVFFFPPWYETNGQYVKQLGRHFFFSRPEAIPVECYLVGCVTAPASYFHVVLNWRSWVETLSTIAAVTTILFLLFRTRTDGTIPSIADARTRLLFSVLVALALPISMSPVVLLGTYGLYVPHIFFGGEHNWLWGSVFFPIILSVYAGAVYLVAAVTVWIAAHKHRERDPAI